MTTQGDRQASFRTLGGTTGTYNSDLRAGCLADEPGIAADGINGVLYEWLGLQGYTESSLDGRMRAYANDAGSNTWSGLGTFTDFDLCLLNDASFLTLNNGNEVALNG